MSSKDKQLPVQPAPSLGITVNGNPTAATATTLAALLAEMGYGDTKVATARNGEFVPERLRPMTLLTDGDQVEIVSPRQGG